MTTSELLNIIYLHYPRGMMHILRIHLDHGELYYRDTVEHHRLVEASDQGREAYPTWKAMIGRLGNRYSVQNESMTLLAGNSVPAYSARLYRPKDLETLPRENSCPSLSFHVSLLGPYYGIHDAGEPDEISDAIAREIEATYPGYHTIPPEIGNVVVPDVDDAGAPMGEATIYTCLFSEVWTWVVPPPLPSP